MAFQIHWKIPFKSLRADTDYCVNIYKDGTLPSGYPLILDGGSHPFTTQEDDNEDMFTPIRTQTGYLRIVDTDKALNSASTPQIVTWNWKDLLPNTDTDRPVTLTANGTIVWQGFMQAQNFGGVLYGNPQEREFPVHCGLIVLEGSDINFQQTALQNFAYLLQRIVNCIDLQSGGMETSGVITANGTVHIENIIIQGNTDARQWLMKKIDWQNFVDEDGDGNLIARFNLYQCLEDLCRFWGWTARTYRKNLYLTRADDSSEQQWLTLTRANLNTLAGGSTAGTTGGAFTNLTPSGDIFASVEQNDIRQRGANRATVKADANRADETFLEFAPDAFIKQMTDGGWQGAIADDGMYVNYTVDKTAMTLPLMTGTAVSGNASFNVANIMPSLGAEGDEFPVIRIKKTYNGTAYASMETIYHHSLKGILVLRGEIYRKAHKFESRADDHNSDITYGNKTMIMRLGIGVDREHASWWDGRTWGDTLTTFIGVIGGSDGIIWSKWERSGGTANLYTRNIGVNGKIGKIFVDFLGSSDLDDVDGQKSFEISEFSLDIAQKPVGRSFGNKEDWLSSREYKSSNQNNVRMEWNADCIYATDLNMANGFGVVLNADGSHFEGFVYGSGSAIAPEQHLANRVTTYWAAAKRKLEVELKTNAITEPTPQNRVKLDATIGYPIAIGREWRDDVTKLTILEL